MPRIEVDGIGIEYELLGDAGAHAIAVTPGGRFSMRAPGIRELADALVAGGRRVLLWDRPNAGASDMAFGGESESHQQARVLVELIRSLDLGKTAVGGGSAGARCSLFAAVQAPDEVSHLLQWWVTGGTVSLFLLGASYFCESALAARIGGMEAVAALPAWSEQLRRNPRNRQRLLEQDPERFIGTMTRWASAWTPNSRSPTPGMEPEDFARLKMPVMIVRGATTDIWHPAEISDWMHRLVPHSDLLEAPWDDGAPLRRLAAARDSGNGHFLDWHMLAPQILEFTSR
ncbi:MAG TPA: alpha/beta hydrolase [Novosphingobium sp.]|nr:alpha/beta hydrolase [Novosphingobium sp.]